jgi:SET domain
MAPSTLGNASNLGIFTAVPLEKGSIVHYPELVIPLSFREWGINPPSAEGDGELWDRYLWDGDVGGIETFDTYDHSAKKSIFVPGIGCTVNSALDLQNIQSTKGSEYDAIVDRGNPSSGSFSPYHNSMTVTTMDLPAGAELLADYGETWIPFLPNIPVLQNKNLDAANHILRTFDEWSRYAVEKYGCDGNAQELLDRIYDITKKFPHPSKVFTVLPPKRPATTDARDYWRSKYQVDVEWLQKHGKCQDHMRPGHSTIPYAGRGAFATRSLRKGTVVGYAPLIHVAFAFDTMTQVKSGQNGTHPDLIWNYSFGHKNSTLTLTPYGGMVNYINHDSKQPNVRVRWPDKELIAHKPEWLSKDLTFLRHSTAGVGLSFDYVALRDIEEGDEILMDYGDDWEEAWRTHVQRWVPPDDALSYVHSSKYDIEELKTPLERQKDPYPPNLETICPRSFRRQDTKYVFAPVLRDWKKYVPCQVVSRTRGGKYVVKLSSLDGSESITVYNVPFPEGIRLVDRAYSQSWHLPGSFRHKIQIPDDVFPDVWKNR